MQQFRMAGFQSALDSAADLCGLDSNLELILPILPESQRCPETHVALDCILALYDQLSPEVTQEVPSQNDLSMATPISVLSKGCF